MAKECSPSVRMVEMSEYLQTLQGPAKARYIEKLRLVGLEECDDPYSESSKFTDDLTLWPAVEYGHILYPELHLTVTTVIRWNSSLLLALFPASQTSFVVYITCTCSVKCLG